VGRRNTQERNGKGVLLRPRFLEPSMDSSLLLVAEEDKLSLVNTIIVSKHCLKLPAYSCSCLISTTTFPPLCPLGVSSYAYLILAGFGDIRDTTHSPTQHPPMLQVCQHVHSTSPPPPYPPILVVLSDLTQQLPARIVSVYPPTSAARACSSP
jgi:hypothetical protein